MGYETSSFLLQVTGVSFDQFKLNQKSSPFYEQLAVCVKEPSGVRCKSLPSSYVPSPS